MVSRTKLDRLIDHAAAHHSAWDTAPADFAALARTARVQHAAEVLLQLGHDVLAGDLLRLERQNANARAETRALPAA